MALFHNFGVNQRNRLCGVHAYASAQFLDFLELAENCAFLDRKLISALKVVVDGHYLNGRVKKRKPSSNLLSKHFSTITRTECRLIALTGSRVVQTAPPFGLHRHKHHIILLLFAIVYLTEQLPKKTPGRNNLPYPMTLLFGLIEGAPVEPKSLS